MYQVEYEWSTPGKLEQWKSQCQGRRNTGPSLAEDRHRNVYTAKVYLHIVFDLI